MHDRLLARYLFDETKKDKPSKLYVNSHYVGVVARTDEITTNIEQTKYEDRLEQAIKDGAKTNAGADSNNVPNEDKDFISIWKSKASVIIELEA